MKTNMWGYTLIGFDGGEISSSIRQSTDFV